MNHQRLLYSGMFFLLLLDTTWATFLGCVVGSLVLVHTCWGVSVICGYVCKYVSK